MEVSQEALQNPFSREKAWMTFQENMETAARLRDEVLQERAEGSVPERELLLKAVDALGRLTDNTILLRVVQKGLESRDPQ